MFSRFCLTLAACAMAATWTAGNARAADDSAHAKKLASSEMIFRSSDLSGMIVYNRDDMTVKLGSLNNLVINAHTGQVLFGVLNTGFGGKLIPVPWGAFQLQVDAKEHKSWLTLNKTSDELKNSPTIEKNNAVDMADTKWLQSLNTFFGVHTVNRPVMEEKKQPGHLTTNQMIFRSSDLQGMKVYNHSDETMKLGSVSDLIVDARTGLIMYGILDTGFGGTYIAGPWSAFQLKEDVKNNKSCLTLNKTSDELKNAPTIDKSHMPDFTDMKWKKTVDDFFGVSTVVRPSESNR
jgi:sporulation protein YlmC with PRC-barrel domain